MAAALLVAFTYMYVRRDDSAVLSGTLCPLGKAYRFIFQPGCT